MGLFDFMKEDKNDKKERSIFGLTREEYKEMKRNKLKPFNFEEEDLEEDDYYYEDDE